VTDTNEHTVETQKTQKQFTQWVTKIENFKVTD